MRRVVVMLAVVSMITAGSGVVAAPAAPAARQSPAAPQFQEDRSEDVPYDLCPPDGAPVDQGIVAAETENGQVQLFVNEQAELFAVSIAGPNADAVQEYINEARFCFDVVLTGAPIERGEETDVEEGEPVDESEFVEADVVVDFAFIGMFPEVGAEEVRAILTEFIATGESLENLPLWFAEVLGVELVDPAGLEERGEAWVLDFYIDPPIAKGVRHYYTTVAKSVKVTVTGKGGQVTANLYLSSSGQLLDRGSDSLGNGESVAFKASTASSKTFKLCVQGDNSSNQYAVGGSTSPWKVGATSSLPSGAASKGTCP